MFRIVLLCSFGWILIDMGVCPIVWIDVSGSNPSRLLTIANVDEQLAEDTAAEEEEEELQYEAESDTEMPQNKT